MLFPVNSDHVLLEVKVRMFIQKLCSFANLNIDEAITTSQHIP